MHSEPAALWGASSCFLGSIALGFKLVTACQFPHLDSASQNRFLSPFGVTHFAGSVAAAEQSCGCSHGQWKELGQRHC